MPCSVFVLPHITASVFINDDEYGLHQDYEEWLEGLAPHPSIRQYRHNDTGEDNADAHMKRHGPPSEAVVVAEVFGTWERILCQLNG